jgi:hypothetical protein
MSTVKGGMIELDSTRLQSSLMVLRDKLPKNLAPEVLKEESRQFIKSMMRLVAPRGTGKGATDRKAGEGAVKGDILRVMRPLASDDFTRNPKLKGAFKKIEADKDFAKAVAIFSNLKGGPLAGAQAVLFSRELHLNKRSRATGRTPKKGLNNIVLGAQQKQLLRAYISQMQFRVGTTKAGWMQSAYALGVNAPDYVARHMVTRGSFQFTTDTNGALIVMVNSQNYWRGSKDTVKYVLKAREGAITSKIARLMRNEAVNLGFGVISTGGKFIPKSET